MPHMDLWVLMGLGGLFIVLGVAALFWGVGEEKEYYRAIVNRNDLREYMEHTPERPEPGGLKIGGVIAVVVGLVMLIIGGAFWFWG
ncbi:MAG: hypothetical protein MUO90_00330 [Dehalococcoidales bacterium]|nr:hypothetical protein [Dehalococcoidales bacterium]